MDPVTQKDFQKFTKEIIEIIKDNGLNSEARLGKVIDNKSKESEARLSKVIKKQFKFYSEQLADKVEYQVEEAVKELKSENLNFKDEIISELKDIRQETSVNTSHRKILTDHETRLTKVENHIFSN
ncbi:hypothetical protein A2572_03485 [Candidatus Collierbacteria bacterium RIFOXYD1_FULL_40_9]|uniref:Uncharacterized protein n=1 Tax=Candidatus Collierbacteria bacterium RIFOXYD1_FULL_40_9 TaxID=1817731 RepID=A0A1F5FTN1_9BACT|nr:MAG: hypothetical protein A2572_03485 [Candidatus Collierbacteria bacterium RIFOXYD1_FULL_40_9]